MIRIYNKISHLENHISSLSVHHSYIFIEFVIRNVTIRPLFVHYVYIYSLNVINHGSWISLLPCLSLSICCCQFFVSIHHSISIEVPWKPIFCPVHFYYIIYYYISYLIYMFSWLFIYFTIFFRSVCALWVYVYFMFFSLDGKLFQSSFIDFLSSNVYWSLATSVCYYPAVHIIHIVCVFSAKKYSYYIYI